MLSAMLLMRQPVGVKPSQHKQLWTCDVAHAHEVNVLAAGP